MMADRAGIDSIDLYRSMKRHLKLERAAEHEVGILLLERHRAGETHFAIRTGEIAAMLNNRTETLRELKPVPGMIENPPRRT